MAKSTYSELLRDPRWQKVRLKKLEAAEWECESCLDSETMLSVHHKRYVKGRMPWEYEQHELVVLCQPCHEESHKESDFRADFLSRLDVNGPLSISDFFAFGAGSVPWWMADQVLTSMLDQVCADFPYQFASGRIALNISHLGLSRQGMTALAEALEKNADLRADIKNLLKERGFDFHGFRKI